MTKEKGEKGILTGGGRPGGVDGELKARDGGLGRRTGGSCPRRPEGARLGVRFDTAPVVGRTSEVSKVVVGTHRGGRLRSRARGGGRSGRRRRRARRCGGGRGGRRVARRRCAMGSRAARGEFGRAVRTWLEAGEGVVAAIDRPL
ncbi:hornerin-like [Iris pallida]|uniref:Hornerin-like n=1 Tax=Iris pallida TaxID=29817 RepID=A0AAX6DPT4_IRIPA|nr:hornerin-like [Iris pallida]